MASSLSYIRESCYYLMVVVEMPKHVVGIIVYVYGALHVKVVGFYTNSYNTLHGINIIKIY